MDIQTYQRKPFDVRAAQVTLENVDELALWCNGIVGKANVRMMGTQTELPCVRVPSKAPDGADGSITAYLGNWIVEFSGNFRVYKHESFENTFVVSKKEHSNEKFRLGQYVMVSDPEDKDCGRVGRVININGVNKMVAIHFDGYAVEYDRGLTYHQVTTVIPQ